MCSPRHRSVVNMRHYRHPCLHIRAPSIFVIRATASITVSNSTMAVAVMVPASFCIEILAIVFELLLDPCGPCCLCTLFADIVVIVATVRSLTIIRVTKQRRSGVSKQIHRAAFLGRRLAAGNQGAKRCPVDLQYLFATASELGSQTLLDTCGPMGGIKKKRNSLVK